jgi:crotonobetainyl-CoA:carnitine CoA-transferase CaiB-like acyl-CoA transferase
VEGSALFHTLNVGKQMMTLDLSSDAGREVFWDLVRWADVLAEAFSPKAMRAWGFDWDTLRTVNPRLVMLSTCLMGQTGPLASFAGFGNLAGAISGFYDTCGWVDRAPAGPFGAYTDYVSPRYNAAAVLAALEHRRRTGRGQHIDLSQAEASVHFLGPAVLDWVVNGRVWSRCGNDDRDAAPHGVYPAAGEDRWVAVTVESDAQWRALCEVIGRPDLPAHPGLETAGGRRAAAEVDAAITAWTAARDAHDAEAALQGRGVPAAAVQTSPDLCADPQLQARGHVASLPHPELGATCVEGPRVVLSRTPGRVDGAAPTLGRDNLHVLQDILGYDEDRITALVAAGLLD